MPILCESIVRINACGRLFSSVSGHHSLHRSSWKPEDDPVFVTTIADAARD